MASGEFEASPWMVYSWKSDSSLIELATSPFKKCKDVIKIRENGSGHDTLQLPIQLLLIHVFAI